MRHVGLRVGVAVAGFALTLQAMAQGVQVFHATGPLPSYEVATIKKPDGGGASSTVNNVTRSVSLSGQTIKNYIQTAYGIQRTSNARLLGGPDWINTDMYAIQGKMPDAMREALPTMTPEARVNQNRMLQQSLLAERFNLKVHFETREMPVYGLVAAKGGFKFKPVPELPVHVAGTPPQPTLSIQFGSGGKMVINAKATTMNSLINLLGNQTEIAERPIIDKTGFAGNFDLVDFQFAGSLGIARGPAQPDPADVDAGSIFTALQETLGLKLEPGKAQVEVVVIDNIERPTEN